MERINKTILRTSLHEMMRLVNDYACDVYIRKDPDDGVTAGEIVSYFAALASPKALKDALKSGVVCCAIYFDLGLIEQLHINGTEFVVEILDDDGNVWATLTEEQLGDW